MKKQFIQLFTCLLIMTIQTAIYAQPKTGNPFGLVYGGAIKENVPGKVNIHPVSYKLNGLTIAANVYTPAGFDTTKKYPVLVLAHPNGYLHSSRCLLPGCE